MANTEEVSLFTPANAKGQTVCAENEGFFEG